MKYRQLLRIIAPVAVLASFFLPVFSGSDVSALTTNEKKDCRSQWQGKAIKASNEDRFKNSNCYKSDYCQIETSREIADDGSATVVRRGACAGSAADNPSGGSQSTDRAPTSCGEIDTSIVNCDSTGGSPVISLLLQVINFLAVGVGIAVVGGIIWGGMVYSSSNGDASKVQQGKMIVVNAVLGLVLFIFMYAIINYLVPGGLFN